jgi:hypothetical protein
MALCGSYNCGCALTVTPNVTGAINGAYPSLTLTGGGEQKSPWDLTLDGNWAAAAIPGPWITPGFAGTWTNYGSGWQACQYRKVGDRVYLRGLVAGGVINNPIFILPVGFRPPATVIFSSETNPNAHARIDVQSDGSVVPVFGSNTYVSISGIWFSTIL